MNACGLKRVRALIAVCGTVGSLSTYSTDQDADASSDPIKQTLKESVWLHGDVNALGQHNIMAKLHVWMIAIVLALLAQLTTHAHEAMYDAQHTAHTAQHTHLLGVVWCHWQHDGG